MSSCQPNPAEIMTSAGNDTRPPECQRTGIRAGHHKHNADIQRFFCRTWGWRRRSKEAKLPNQECGNKISRGPGRHCRISPLVTIWTMRQRVFCCDVDIICKDYRETPMGTNAPVSCSSILNG